MKDRLNLNAYLEHWEGVRDDHGTDYLAGEVIGATRAIAGMVAALGLTPREFLARVADGLDVDPHAKSGRPARVDSRIRDAVMNHQADDDTLPMPGDHASPTEPPSTDARDAYEAAGRPTTWKALREAFDERPWQARGAVRVWWRHVAAPPTSSRTVALRILGPGEATRRGGPGWLWPDHSGIVAYGEGRPDPVVAYVASDTAWTHTARTEDIGDLGPLAYPTGWGRQKKTPGGRSTPGEGPRSPTGEYPFPQSIPADSPRNPPLPARAPRAPLPGPGDGGAVGVWLVGAGR